MACISRMPSLSSAAASPHGSPCVLMGRTVSVLLKSVGVDLGIAKRLSNAVRKGGLEIQEDEIR